MREIRIARMEYLAAIAEGRDLNTALQAWFALEPEQAGDARLVLRTLADLLNEDQALTIVCFLAIGYPELVLEACNGLL